MKKILVVGSSTVDLVFKSHAFEQRQIGTRWNLAHGGKYLVDYFDLFFGGGGANFSVSLTLQKNRAILWSMIGQDHFGRLVFHNLKSKGVRTVLIQRSKDKTAVSAILIDDTGDKTVLNYRSTGDNLYFSSRIKRAVKKADWLAILSMALWPKEQKLEVLKWAKKYQKSVFLSLHGSEYKKGVESLKDYFQYCDVLHLNAYELADLLKKKASSLNLYQENISRLLGIPLVLVTYDVKGSFAYTPAKIYYQDIVKPKIITDTTGAGDAYASGFLGRYWKTGQIQEAMLFGAQNSASLIEQYGAQNGLLKK
jgi:sugar/nucleoside kinase (ribokinase family)